MYVNEAMEYAINQDDDRGVVAGKLGLTKAMISHYLNRDNTPGLRVAAKLGGESGLVVEPFTELAVIKKWTEMTSDDAS